ncbi:MAG: hypothetical protein AB1631_08135 [Acidobacteriota bacterium]
MKKAALFLLLGFCLAALMENYLKVDSSSILSKTVIPTLMKEHTIYSWKEKGEWHFALITKGQRARAIEEIKSSSLAVKGVNDLKKRLDLMPRHQRIVWSAREEGLSLPPESIISQIKGYCDSFGLILQVDRSR